MIGDGPGDGEKIFLDYDQAELNRQYDQRTLVPDISVYNERWTVDSQRARDTLDCRLDIAYGAHPDQTLDVFKPERDGAPILVFIHGGAWRQLSKNESAAPANVFVPAGTVYVALNFSLAPDAGLDEIVGQVRQGVAHVYRNGEIYGGNPDRLFVAGHSSGGHLTAMMGVTDWPNLEGLPADTIKGFSSISGIYDLEPVRLSARNDYLFLDEAAEIRNGSIRHIRAGLPPALIGWGGKELDEFQRQGQAFLDGWQAAGLTAEKIFMPDRNHFDMGDEYANEQGPVVQALKRMMGL